MPLRVGVKAVLMLVSVVLGTAVAVLVWSDVTRASGRSLWETFSLGIAFLSFFGVGMVIALRRPRHPIGWLFIATGVYPMTQEAVATLGRITLERDGGETLVLIGHTLFSWPALFGLLVVFIPLLFPTGRLPSQNWRWLAWPAATAIGVMAAGGILQRDVCVTYAAGECARRIQNPIGLPWLAAVEEGVVGGIMLAVLAACMVGAWASVVVRYRRSHGVERTQLRWFTFAMGLFLAYMVVVGLLVETLDLSSELVPFSPWALLGVFLALVPISVGVAVLRYRLYDIDRLISRTVSYGLITAVLLGTYTGVVFILRRLLPAQSDLAVAASTLAVAAIFHPVRWRIQVAVDRRFNRSRYDIERVVDAFAVRLRSEVSIDDLAEELIDAADAAMQPSTSSVWLNGPSA